VSKKPLFILVFLFFVCSVQAQSPVALNQGIVFRDVVTDINGGIRLAYDPVESRLLYLTMGGDIYEADLSVSGQTATRIYDSSDHGLGYPVMGMTVGSDGTIYLVGNDVGTEPGKNIGVLKRGWINNGVRNWEIVAKTEAFGRSETNYDHNFNAIVLSPDEQYLYFNSGSRTDHGEVQNNNGQFIFAREYPITSAIFKIPTASENLLLLNDEEFLNQNGYLFADGVRNTFSLAFDGEGNLFGSENSGDRDDHEELNLLREGHHYGFPWRMGDTDTPQRFAGYDPSTDLLLNPDAGAVRDGYFYNDTRYPNPPAGVVFSDPAINLGPDADLYRDPATGMILDASENSRTLSTFTAHRSPLGLVFDTQGVLPEPYKNEGLVLSWTGPESNLLFPFSGEGEDLLLLEFESKDDPPRLRATRIVSDLLNPIDAILVGDKLYVLEFGSGAKVWEIGFAENVATESELPGGLFELDVYPNPARNYSSVSIRSSAFQHLDVSLYSMQGKRVQHIHDGFLTPGQLFSSKVDTSHLSAGVYALIVRGEMDYDTRTIVVLK